MTKDLIQWISLYCFTQDREDKRKKLLPNIGGEKTGELILESSNNTVKLKPEYVLILDAIFNKKLCTRKELSKELKYSEGSIKLYLQDMYNIFGIGVNPSIAKLIVTVVEKELQFD